MIVLYINTFVHKAYFEKVEQVSTYNHLSGCNIISHPLQTFIVNPTDFIHEPKL
jgi:hypothetical protein